MVPYRMIFPAILLFCSHRHLHGEQQRLRRWLDTALFGLFGYLCAKLGIEPAPMLLGFMLGR
jgi:putative tricarboxylic transport membrane protein